MEALRTSHAPVRLQSQATVFHPFFTAFRKPSPFCQSDALQEMPQVRICLVFTGSESLRKVLVVVVVVMVVTRVQS